MISYTTTTEGVTVSVRPLFVEDQSDILAKKFVFAYFIRIENHRQENVRLVKRYWHIVHSNGREEEVRGDGVVGQQPLIAPGAFHEYHSFCILETFAGHMEGTYAMEHADGEPFEIAIPRFHLIALGN
jgi:ApaG protein